MELTLFWIALILGVVEGLTEFLPVSSTGHLIVTSAFLGLDGKRGEVFGVFIQLGAILAVVWEYRPRLVRLAREITQPRARNFILTVGLAFLPAACVGLLVHDLISEYLFSPSTVAAALIAGAFLIFAVEALPLEARTKDVETVSWKQGLWIGIAQCAALWPGFSRSAATILGGLCVGLDRRAATEFSFFLAIPTMFAATSYSLLKNYRYLEPGDGAGLTLAFVVSFLVGWASVRWLLRYVSTHTFRAFAWYRLAFGMALLVAILRFGWF